MPSSVAASDGANCVDDRADMQALTPILPAVVAPGSTISTNAVCVNNGPSGASQPTCNITSNIPGAIVTVGICAPPLPLDAIRASAGNNSISCPVTIQIPGAQGGTDIPLTSGSFTVTAGSSSPDPNPSNNTASKTFTVIDAIDDAPQSAPQGQAVTLNVLGNDTVGTVPATAANVAVTVLSGAPAGTTVDSNGNIVVPASTPAGSYTLTYQICAVPAQTPPACDTAIKPLTITALPVIDVRKNAGVPLQTGPSTFAVPFGISVGNNGPTTVPNVQAIENLQRTFPAPAVVTVTPVTITAQNGATCSRRRPASTASATTPCSQAATA
ncbi:MAG: hypothetical protein HC765_11065 [Brachymonas sp.]|nr:hypothetical protein [Brachymonas sp.]